MIKYKILTNVLDAIIEEAPSTMSKKYPSLSLDAEKNNQARARAFIHLYLKVSFGMLSFVDREYYITDGAQDGGIDGYYINKENKTIYFIQSKFRTTSQNFKSKEIELSEILVMDINRIVGGEQDDETGKSYNGKIKQLQRDISTVEDIARYSYQVIILANLNGIKESDLRKLTGGFSGITFDFEKCYQDLVFPVISGTYYKASDLNINIDLSNKNAGSKISYTVWTSKGECEITVLFIPTIEIGKVMYKYKNSILKYNPRSYLGLEGKKVNDSITETIINKQTNEFALYNNGITMLSDETYINERIGQKNKAQLIVKNPQIINGGQTSFTLSRIYEQNINNAEAIFQDKEVLVKIITLLDNNNHNNKLDLIKDISEATNQQTPVINADKIANDDLQIKIQDYLFSKYGLLYERKRGEFADGIFNKYVDNNDILERNLFFRVYYAANGKVTKAREKKLFVNQNVTFEELIEGDKLDNSYFGYLCFKKLSKLKHPNQRVEVATYAKVRAMTILYKPEKIENYNQSVLTHFEEFDNKWKEFIAFYKSRSIVTKTKKNRKTGEIETRQSYDYSKSFNREEFSEDVKLFFTKKD